MTTLSISAIQLRAALEAISAPRPLRAVLHVDANSAEVFFIAYSGEVYAVSRAQLQALSDSALVWLFDYKSLVELVNTSRDRDSEYIRLEFSDSTPWVTVKIGSSKSRLVRITDTFPNLDTFEQIQHSDVALIALSREVFMGAFELAVIAAAKDDARPVLTGIKITLTDSNLTMACADGYRLSVRNLEVSDVVRGAEGDWLIPAVLAERILKAQKGETVQFGSFAGMGRFVLRSGMNTYVINEIDGKFPDYTTLMGGALRQERIVMGYNRAELADALNLAHIFARDNNDSVSFWYNQDRFGLTARSPERGDMTCELADVISEASLTALTHAYPFAINGVYLAQYLARLPKSSEQVWMSLADPSTPVLLGADGDRDGDVYVIMPMSVRR